MNVRELIAILEKHDSDKEVVVRNNNWPLALESMLVCGVDTELNRPSEVRLIVNDSVPPKLCRYLRGYVCGKRWQHEGNRCSGEPARAAGSPCSGNGDEQ